MENNNQLSFLDITITKSNNDDATVLDLSIFRKKTFTGLGMNFHSSTYYKFKINNIKTLLNRAYALCNTWVAFHKEVTFLLNYFHNNLFPKDIIFNIIYKFMNAKIGKSQPTTSKANKLTIYSKIPFINNPACKFIEKEPKAVISKYYPQIDLKPVFMNNLTIQCLTSH